MTFNTAKNIELQHYSQRKVVVFCDCGGFEKSRLEWVKMKGCRPDKNVYSPFFPEECFLGRRTA